MQVDLPFPAGVQRTQRLRCLCRRVVVEPTRNEHDAAREESLLEPVAEAHVSSVQGGPTLLTPNLGPKRIVRYRGRESSRANRDTPTDDHRRTDPAARRAGESLPRP